MRRIITNLLALLLCCSLASAGQLSLLGVGTPGAAPPAGVTFDPANKGTIISLSNGNLTASTTTTGTQQIARSTTSHSSGKFYVEFNLCGGTGVSNAVGVGHADGSASLTNYLGGDAHGVGWYNTNQVYFNNGQLPVTYPTFANSCFLGEAIDLNGDLYWNTSDGTTFNSGGSASPVTGVGGGGTLTGAVYIAIALADNNSATATITANFAGPFHYSSLYTSLQGVGYTTW